jgi:deoxyribodipyrimidine photolyase-related protein
MSSRSSNLFHTRISALVNLHRLLPARVVRDVAAMEIPMASKEGFIRQVLGWREFMRHVHEETDGFRLLEKSNVLDAHQPLPAAFWRGGSYGERVTGMNCVDSVIEDVWREGYSHHITRLMVLSNLATLLDVSPRELTDWFWVAYVDAYDWVVEPNVLGMSTFSLGPVFTTKPYVSGSNYIHRMSDYCEGCKFDPKTTCPFPSLYWAFLARHADVLERNPRISMLYRSLAKRPPEQLVADQKVFDAVKSSLGI